MKPRSAKIQVELVADEHGNRRPFTATATQDERGTIAWTADDDGLLRMANSYQRDIFPRLTDYFPDLFSALIAHVAVYLQADTIEYPEPLDLSALPANTVF